LTLSPLHKRKKSVWKKSLQLDHIQKSMQLGPLHKSMQLEPLHKSMHFEPLHNYNKSGPILRSWDPYLSQFSRKETESVSKTIFLKFCILIG
jgi:hypothetical protein